MTRRRPSPAPSDIKVSKDSVPAMPRGAGVGGVTRFILGGMFLVPVYLTVSLWILTPGGFPIESIGFLAFRALPLVAGGAGLLLAGMWWFAPGIPRIASLTLAALIAFHALAGLFLFPLTYAILIVPMIGWSLLVGMFLRRLDWAAAPPLAWWADKTPRVFNVPDTHPPPDSPAENDVPGAAETLEERFDRLRMELRPKPETKQSPRPSPLFLGFLALIGGLLSAILFLPSAPATLPLYGEQTENFEAEPLWDPLLLRPVGEVEVQSVDSIGIQRLWRPQSRLPELPGPWEEMLKTPPVSVTFSKRSSLVRIEAPGCSANVNPLMDIPEISADGFALLPWNRGTLSSGSATGWQVWSHDNWLSWVRYSGDPWISGAWPSIVRRGLHPWLGKVAVQVVTDGPDVAVVLASVNRLNLPLSARHADLCSLSLEPIREARVVWATDPFISDELQEHSMSWLHRSGSGFRRYGHSVDDAGKVYSWPEQDSIEYQSWIIVRQRVRGPGFLIWCPFWKRQIGVDKPGYSHTDHPTNHVSVRLEGLTVQLRYSLLSAHRKPGASVARLAPGTYLNVLLLIPLAEGQPDAHAVAVLHRMVTQHGTPLLNRELRGLALPAPGN